LGDAITIKQIDRVNDYWFKYKYLYEIRDVKFREVTTSGVLREETPIIGGVYVTDKWIPDILPPDDYPIEMFKEEKMTGSDIEFNCGECKATKYVTCEECGGNGKIMCPRCNGRGVEGGTRIPCKKCLKNLVVTCPECEGTQRVLCNFCLGQGSLRRFVVVNARFYTKENTGIFQVTPVPNKQVYSSLGETVLKTPELNSANLELLESPVKERIKTDLTSFLPQDNDIHLTRRYLEVHRIPIFKILYDHDNESHYLYLTGEKQQPHIPKRKYDLKRASKYIGYAIVILCLIFSFYIYNSYRNENLRQGEIISIAEKAMGQNKWDKAISDLQNISLVNSEAKLILHEAKMGKKEYLVSLGVNAAKEKNWLIAIDHFSNIYKIDKSFKDTENLLLDSLYNYGLSLQDNKQLDQSLAVFLKIVELNSSYLDTQDRINAAMTNKYNTAKNAAKKKQWIKAENILNEILSIDQSFKDTHKYLKKVQKDRRFSELAAIATLERERKAQLEKERIKQARIKKKKRLVKERKEHEWNEWLVERESILSDLVNRYSNIVERKIRSMSGGRPYQVDLNSYRHKWISRSKVSVWGTANVYRLPKMIGARPVNQPQWSFIGYKSSFGWEINDTTRY